MEQKMAIISGASGTLGKAYVDHFAKDPNVRCVAITRRDESIPNAITVHADLLNAEETAAAIQKLDLAGVREIILVHPVGMFKFEEGGTPDIDADGDGVDDEILASNIATLNNIVRPLREKIANTGAEISLTLSAFGSLSDPYNIQYWQSYSKAKNALRTYMRELAAGSNGQIKSVFFSVSTVNTEKERSLRPNADPQYWLTTEELVERSLPYLEHAELWKDVDIFKEMPGFKPEYYSDREAIREKWSREMGRKLL